MESPEEIKCWEDQSESGERTLCWLVVQSLREPVRVLDASFRVVLANATALQIKGHPGRDEPVGCRIDQYEGQLRECADCLVKETFDTGRAQVREMTGIDSNGDRWVTEIRTEPLYDSEGKVTHVVETFHDKSREKRLERQLFQSSKLASIGEVVAGIAHEIRNPLAGIRLGLDAIEPMIADSSGEAREILEDIIRDIGRLNRVVTDLLNFTRPHPHEPEWFLLRLLFEEVRRLIRQSAKQQGIKIEIKVEPEDLEIWGDRNQIHQVLLNILLNSVQAMPEGGNLYLWGNRSENINWSTNREKPGGYRIVIKDTGTGIPEEHMNRLFDPFFTTKPNGTGLGLTTSFAIIRKHEGELRINSKFGEGTTAQILLPEGVR